MPIHRTVHVSDVGLLTILSGCTVARSDDTSLRITVDSHISPLYLPLQFTGQVPRSCRPRGQCFCLRAIQARRHVPLDRTPNGRQC